MAVSGEEDLDPIATVPLLEGVCIIIGVVAKKRTRDIIYSTVYHCLL